MELEKRLQERNQLWLFFGADFHNGSHLLTFRKRAASGESNLIRMRKKKLTDELEDIVHSKTDIRGDTTEEEHLM